MAPVWSISERLLGVLGVVDHQIGIATQLDHVVVHSVTIGRCLVIGEIGQHLALELDPISEGPFEVRNGADSDTQAAELEVDGIGQIVEPDRPFEVHDADREKRRLDGTGQNVVK